MAQSRSTDKKFGRLPTNRLRWCRISPIRPSSPSRTRVCSTSCAKFARAADGHLGRTAALIFRRCRAEVDSVFAGAVLDNAVPICDAKFGTLYLCEGGGFSRRGHAQRASGLCGCTGRDRPSAAGYPPRHAAKTKQGRPSRLDVAKLPRAMSEGDPICHLRGWTWQLSDRDQRSDAEGR